MTYKQKQLLLCYFDLLTPADVDGIWGPKSMAATKTLQRRLELVEDGIFGSGTAAAVGDLIAYGGDLPPEKEPEGTTGLFWDHIRYWTREEFRCRCHEYYQTPYCSGFPVEPDQTLVELVDDIRHEAGRPGHRSSGLRCQIHNDLQPGSVPNSKHRIGKAFDFMIEGMTGNELLALALADPRTSYAYIIGNGPYVHVDVA